MSQFTNDASDRGVDNGAMRQEVMRRVWTVYVIRRVLNSEVVKGAVFGACCVTAVFLVSVPSVIQNMKNVPGITAELSYLFGAFLNTSVIVEGVVLVAAGVGCLLVWDIGRNVSSAGYSLLMRGRSRV